MTLLAAKEILLSLEYYHFDIGMVHVVSRARTSRYSLLLPECAPSARPPRNPQNGRLVLPTRSIDSLVSCYSTAEDKSNNMYYVVGY